MAEEIIDSTATDPNAPPPAAEEPAAIVPPAKGMHEMSREERREFLSGKDPKAAKADTSDGKPADSSTAPADGKKAAETAATTAKTASETVAPAKDTKDSSKAEHDFNRILTDRRRETDRANRAERERDELTKRIEALEGKPKTDGKTAATSTAADPSQPKWKKYREMPGAPKITEFEDPDDWGAALAVFVAEHIAGERVESTLKERDEQSGKLAEGHREMERVVNIAADRLGADEKAHPDLIAVINPKLRDLVPMRLLPDGTQPNVDHFIKDCIVFDGDHPLQLHAFYSTDEGWEEWQAMRGQDRRTIERTIQRRDISFGTSPQGQPAAAKAVAKTRSTAPAPPDKSGPKAATNADAADQAVRNGDFAALVSELDEREGVQTRRYGRRRG